MTVVVPPPLPTYLPGASGPRVPGLVELASNENPAGPSAAAAAAGQSAVGVAHRYPEHDAGTLRRAVATHWALAPDQVLVTPGSTALIDTIARALLGPGTSAVVAARSFLAYDTSVRATGAGLVRAPMSGDAIDLDAMGEAIRPDTRAVFVANPNNPTGTAFDAPAFARFLDRVPSGVTVVLDEAYAEYGQDLPDGPALVRSGRELLVLRTFSKVYALAGLRVGYGLGPAALVRRLSALTPPFGVGHAAQEAAVAALADQAHVRATVAANTDGRRALIVGLRALGLSPADSAANFVYVDVHRPADEVRDAMLAAGVRVRSLAAWGAPTAVRITVGTPADVAAALRCLATTLAS